MAKIPKYVEKLLDRREKLACELRDVSVKLDEYCGRIGLDYTWMDTAVLCSDFRIYMEPGVAYEITRRYIELALDGRLEEERRDG